MSSLDRVFRISIILKALDGLFEVIGGVLLLIVPPHAITRLVQVLTQHELLQDPHDVIANHLLTAASRLGPTQTIFGFIYLLTHGLVKIVLVIALLKQKLWAYPWMIGFLVLFIGYQLYRLTTVFSLWLVALTVFDALVAWLTWLEYRQHQAKTA